VFSLAAALLPVEDPLAVEDPAEDEDPAEVEHPAEVEDPEEEDPEEDTAASFLEFVEEPWTTSFTVLKPILNLTMTAVMLSQPVPSPWVSGARQCSKSCKK